MRIYFGRGEYVSTGGIGGQSINEDEIILEDANLFVGNVIDSFVIVVVLAAICMRKTNRNRLVHFDKNKVPLLT